MIFGNLIYYQKNIANYKLIIKLKIEVDKVQLFIKIICLFLEGLLL